jgi:tripartite-type tricarboxylate transporter receptor subunit TctC
MKTIQKFVQRRTSLKWACIVTSATLLSGISLAHAQTRVADYPSRPIKLVVPYPPGGGADTLARLVAAGMAVKLAQPVVIENKPGGNTAIATEYVANQPADGYTLLYVASAFTINPSFYTLRYSTENDFVPIALVARIPFVIETNNQSSIHSVQDLIAEAKKRPGELSYATYGTGSPVHLAAELFQVMTGTKLLHVPYKGSAPGLTDLMGGQVDLAFGSIEPSLQLMRNKKIRPLAVTTSSRIAAAPDIPTVAESGVPGFETIGWNGIVAPVNTPKPIVDRLNHVINEVLQEPVMRERLLSQGVELDIKTSEQISILIHHEITKWAALVKQAGVKAD